MTDSSAEIIRRWSGSVPGTVADRTGDSIIAERGHQRMGVLLEAFGNPQLDYKTIHIAGSKGKGTTAAFVAEILNANGIRTGLYTSPHLRFWNERIAVNVQLVEEAPFARLLGTVESTMNRIQLESPEFGEFNAFELLTATAFLHFRNQECKFAVIEVGLGGRYDSTNHLLPEVAVITRIEAEHLDILGPTIEDVAWNKAGIIQSGVPAVVSQQEPAVMEVIAREAHSLRSAMFLETVDWQIERETAAFDQVRYRFQGREYHLSQPALPGDHNLRNLGAALSAVATAAPLIDLESRESQDALRGMQIPGRFHLRSIAVSGLTLVLDVAHTPESLRNLIRTAVTEFGITQFEFVLGVLSDKPIPFLLEALEGSCRRLLLPMLSNPRAADPQEIASLARIMGIPYDVYVSAGDALDALSGDLGPALITGSFGIVAETLDLLDAESSRNE